MQYKIFYISSFDDQNKEDKQRKDSDIYVYFKKKYSAWTKLIKLGNEVNSNFGETYPIQTVMKKHLKFLNLKKQY